MRQEIKIFEKNNSVYFQCLYKTINNKLVDPTAPTYTITDSAGAIATSGVPTKDSIGKYYFYYKFATEGKYRIAFGGKVDAQDILGVQIFEVKETTIS